LLLLLLMMMQQVKIPEPDPMLTSKPLLLHTMKTTASLKER
jgi:hypothetical protein